MTPTPSSQTPLAPQATTLTQPTKLNLYPSADGNRLFVMLTGIGSEAVNLPLIFDTGSAGLSVNALDIFPSAMVSSGGFIFSPGQNAITYNAITVTNQTATREYGGSTGTTQHGNLGFASVTFGDSSGQITTASIPIFLYYAVTSTPTGQAITPDPQQGVFGVDPAPGTINVTDASGGASDYQLCSSTSGATCYVFSVLSSVTYVAGLDAGFMLAPANLACTGTPAQCPAQSILTVGLTTMAESPFSTVRLTCPPNSYPGPTTVNGNSVCAKDIADATITVTGIGQFCGPVLFDTGTPDIQLNVPSDACSASFTSATDASVAGASVMVQTPSGFVYNFVAGPPYSPGVNSPSSIDLTQDSTADTVLGIFYFTTNSFFIDYATNIEGWM
jgi:hypothetical protein